MQLWVLNENEVFDLVDRIRVVSLIEIVLITNTGYIDFRCTFRKKYA